MKLAVLGGSSMDRHFINYVLRTGYAVKLLTTEVPAVSHANLAVIAGVPTDQQLLETALKNTHAVICMPGAVSNLVTLQTLLQTMFAHGITRLILVADVQQATTQHFEATLKKTNIDWTMIEYTPTPTPEEKFAIKQADLAKYIAGQITSVTHLRSALLLSN